MKPEIEKLECGCRVVVVECVDGEIIKLTRHCKLHMPKPVDFDNEPKATYDESGHMNGV
jgi:hypothetical protein